MRKFVHSVLLMPKDNNLREFIFNIIRPVVNTGRLIFNSFEKIQIRLNNKIISGRKPSNEIALAFD